MPHPSVPFIYTRKDYIQNNMCTHEQYYAQLVRPALVEQIILTFGMEKLTSPKNDGHFNHIPLKYWDTLTHNIEMPKQSDWKMVEDYPTMAGMVCVLKAAARMAVEQEQQ